MVITVMMMTAMMRAVMMMVIMVVVMRIAKRSNTVMEVSAQLCPGNRERPGGGSSLSSENKVNSDERELSPNVFVEIQECICFKT